MKTEQHVAAHLDRLEQVLKKHHLWQSVPPEAQAFTSSEPFCLDTLHPLEWLQWVLLPRMYALLEGKLPLPTNFAVAPYYEMYLEAEQQGRDELLLILRQLDGLFNQDAH